jgi:uncharacterized protein YqjF (DUF2071 family)
MERDYATGHRPWPLPTGPWIMEQQWHNLLFAHWAVDPAAVRALVPAGLEVDTYGGQAWIGVIVFRLSGVRMRGLPPLPGLAAFPEVNLRLYVTAEGKPGVQFLSLDASNLPALALARPWWRLPYHYAGIEWYGEDDHIAFAAARRDDESGAALEVSYTPSGPVQPAARGSLAAWLTERYCYYTTNRRGDLYRCEIHHAPWLLQPARATLAVNTLAAAGAWPCRPARRCCTMPATWPPASGPCGECRTRSAECRVEF